MRLILPNCAMTCTALTTVTTLVFCTAMSANSTPAQLRALKLWMSGLSLPGVADTLAVVFLIRASQPGWASSTASAPSVIFGIILLVSPLQ